MAVDPAAIEPGSTEYGDRQTLEAGLQQVGGAGAVGGAAPASPTTTMPAMSNPMSALLSGEIAPPGDQPLTAGLSVGPGEGPGTAFGPLDNDLGTRLKMIAEQSSSPTLRRLAIAKLRRMYRGVDSDAN